MNEYVQKNLKPDEKLVREIELGMTNLTGYIINMIVLLIFSVGPIIASFKLGFANSYVMYALLAFGVIVLLGLAYYIVFMIFEIRNCNSTVIALTDKRLFGKKVFAGTEEFSIDLENIEGIRISIPYFTGGMGIYSNRTLVIKVKDASAPNGIITKKFRSVKKAGDIVGIIQAEKSRKIYEMNLAAAPATAPVVEEKAPVAEEVPAAPEAGENTTSEEKE